MAKAKSMLRMDATCASRRRHGPRDRGGGENSRAQVPARRKRVPARIDFCEGLWERPGGVLNRKAPPCQSLQGRLEPMLPDSARCSTSPKEQRRRRRSVRTLLTKALSAALPSGPTPRNCSNCSEATPRNNPGSHSTCRPSDAGHTCPGPAAFLRQGLPKREHASRGGPSHG